MPRLRPGQIIFLNVVLLSGFLVAHDVLRTSITARYGVGTGLMAGHILTGVFFVLETSLVWIVFRQTRARRDDGPKGSGSSIVN